MKKAEIILTLSTVGFYYWGVRSRSPDLGDLLALSFVESKARNQCVAADHQHRASLHSDPQTERPPRMAVLGGCHQPGYHEPSGLSRVLARQTSHTSDRWRDYPPVRSPAAGHADDILDGDASPSVAAVGVDVVFELDEVVAFAPLRGRDCDLCLVEASGVREHCVHVRALCVLVRARERRRLREWQRRDCVER
eukprot:CAMPEP_0179875708 /NCGR_PEP_ID=MMETSP0982-20121206/23738_1 /TAXON_ID=483367 /ORGANISM="non described non described, Strain CCMP 2436" /LENGTH=193 /DNA_ID=CAMNT_0021767933 /DNA_START=75 /DNA_END=657 /DNA_ORIENTATION=+